MKSLETINKTYDNEIKSILFILKEQVQQTETGFNFNFDIEKLLAYSGRHRITPIVFKFFNKNSRYTDAKTLSVLKDLTTKHSLDALKLLNELLLICREFNSAGIKYLVIKGPQLSHYLYGDASVRVSVDLDIFLEDYKLIWPAGEILKKIGFLNTDLPKKKSLFSRFFFRIGKHEAFFLKKSTRTFVDLHIRPVGNSIYSNRFYRLFFSDIFAYHLNGVKIPVLHPEKYFLFLCYHGAVHHFSSLHWVNDAYIFASKISFDKEKLKKESRRLKLSKSVYLTYSILNELFNFSVPEIFKSRDTLQNRFLIRVCLDGFKHDRNYGFTFKGRLENTIYRLLLSESILAKGEIFISIISRYIYKLLFRKVYH